MRADKEYAAKTRKDYQEKANVKDPVVINPIMDKWTHDENFDMSMGHQHSFSNLVNNPFKTVGNLEPTILNHNS